MRGFRVKLKKGERSICLFKHPRKDLYCIKGTTEDRTQEIVFSGEAMRALIAMFKQFKGRMRKSTTTILVELYEESPQQHWVLVESKDKQRDPST